MSKQSLPFITDVTNLKGKRVIVRVDFNVPLEDGQVRNYFRIMRTIPTLLYLLHAGAKVIIISHLGRNKKDTLEPVHQVLKEHVPVSFIAHIGGKQVEEAVANLADGEAVLLENLRSVKGETEDQITFARELADYADIYVNDAFSVSHREHASVHALPRLLPAYFGLTFREEYTQLVKVMAPTHPSIFIIGGAKFATKQPLIEKYLHKYDYVFVGGALANDMFKAKGYEVGKSLTSDTTLDLKHLLENPRLLLPDDVTVQSGSSIRVTTPDAVESEENILDAGPATVAQLKNIIEDSVLVVWNGPLGDYEHGFSENTRALAEVIAESSAYSVIGGGDTVAVVETAGLNDRFNFISTAGGAMLSFLEHGTLPGIEAVVESTHRK